MPDITIMLPNNVEYTENDIDLLKTFIKGAVNLKNKKQFISFMGYCIAECKIWTASNA